MIVAEETSTALPIGTGSGRRLRRELLELERQQAGTKFETKLMKNIPFIQFNWMISDKTKWWEAITLSSSTGREKKWALEATFQQNDI